VSPNHQNITKPSQLFAICSFLKRPDTPESRLSRNESGKEFEMYKHKSNIKQAPICDLVPGYGFYSNMGNGLAENLVNAFDWLADFITRSRN
jgi:hypothetical protein